GNLRIVDPRCRGRTHPPHAERLPVATSPRDRNAHPLHRTAFRQHSGHHRRHHHRHRHPGHLDLASRTHWRGGADMTSRNIAWDEQREELASPPGWWIMLFLVFTEAALFASLLLAYFYERANAPEWPPAGIAEPELVLPLIITALLVGS